MSQPNDEVKSTLPALNDLDKKAGMLVESFIV